MKKKHEGPRGSVWWKSKGAVPNRMKVKRRKAGEPVGELVNGGEAHIRWSGRVLATGLARSSTFLPSETSRLPPDGGSHRGPKTSQLEPMKRIAKMLRAHRALLLNWFKAKGEIALGVVEGLNSNAKLAIRKARGFRTYEALETALYHQLGHLPEPHFAHRFCQGGQCFSCKDRRTHA